ncbi:mannose-6-phosphate isomerase, class I [Nesterenkonia populi]|uniref:mannose-6-phosphate isomerase, class I n=1 Tax=Nesterenkonia populi TaxID=1591087 RepID=UPI001FEB063D|nr:mannose-6-phosphate isomerase, class I [Nesterenkonia populi]
MINPFRDYAWGSTTAFSRLFGWEAAQTPQAEMWMGAHPTGTSRVETAEGETVGLDALLAERPELLGAAAEQFGQLPFLLKVLAAEKPLSIQAHPTVEQAKAGFEGEESAGIALGSPARCYPDAHHKPELIVALTDFSALTGFRPHADAAEELGRVHALAEERGYDDAALTAVISTLTRQLGGRDYAAALDFILASGQEQTAQAAQALAALVQMPAPSADRLSAAAWDTLSRIAAKFPGDPGIFVALLLNRVDLQPGEGLYLPAGNLHAYLGGAGVEIMANSDNVLRGGLTSKHIDVPALIDVAETEVLDVPNCVPQLVTKGQLAYRPPFEEFELTRFSVESHGDIKHRRLENAPGILLCTGGKLTVLADQPSEGPGHLSLKPGESVFIPAGEAVRFGGDIGTAAYLASVPGAVQVAG